MIIEVNLGNSEVHAYEFTSNDNKKNHVCK